MNLLSKAEAALKTNRAAFIRYELADDATIRRKGEYVAVYGGDGSELLKISRTTLDRLARDGIVRASPFDPEQRTYCFHQTAAV